ncbi:Nif3-like dinuclear metal center hexameric protein [Bacillus sp. FSL W7-1360]
MKKKALHMQTLLAHFATFAPKHYEMDGDKNGLMVGTLNKHVKRVMTALDVLEETIDEAIDEQVDLIIAHHPLLFRPLKQIDTSTAIGRIVSKALQHDITIYAAHTNLDVAQGGVNDLLAKQLNLTNTRVLVPTHTEAMQKLVVFVPMSHIEEVREALGQAGAGHIGEYSHCAFQTEGTGTFRPSVGANPYIGSAGKQEFVEEIRLETIVTKKQCKAVLTALKRTHPYEEPAYDVYPLEEPAEQLGLGRIGSVHEATNLNAYARFVKEALQLQAVRVVGNGDTPIRKVAVLGGDGNKYVGAAKRAGADVLITGDVYYHVAQDALMDEFCLIDAGHHIEHVMKEGVASRLQAFVVQEGYDAEVFASTRSTDPFLFV